MSTESIGPANKVSDGKLAFGMRRNGKVVELHFGTWVNWIDFDATSARNLAAALIEAADEIDGKRK